MRISTSMIFDAGVAAMGRQQDALLHTQQQIASGRRMLTAADDPVAAAQALNLSEADNINAQYSSNRDAAKNLLGLTENALQSVTDLLQTVRVTAVYAGNPTLTDSDRASLMQTLISSRQELLGLANSTDGTGNFLFAGYQSASPACAQTAGGSVQYLGDQGQRLIQVSASRQMPVSESGYQVFQNIMAGNGTFVAAATSTNAGTGTISPGSVLNSAVLTGHSYQINFSVVGGVTTYDVVDTTSSVTLSTGNAYTSGAAIVFDGQQIQIDGAPANGDQFTVVPSTRQSIFDTLDNLIAALRTSAGGAAASTQLANNVGSALTNIDQDLNHVLDVRAGIGARLNEVDALAGSGDNLGLQYKQELSRLQDVDVAGAISMLNQQQLALQAAQKSFAQVSGLSLFQYL